MKSLAPSSPVLKPPDPKKLSPLPDSFYLRNTLEVARDLLGKGLVVKGKGGLLLAEIVEVEAYLGHEDPASHAYRGINRRNEPMFGQGGTCYVYLSYGINYCMNVSTREKGVGQAVLLRGVRPLVGISEMAANRGNLARECLLTNGPGKLTQALGVNLSFSGRRFDHREFKLVDLGIGYAKSEVAASPRIGISKAKENPWRLFVKGSPWLSRKG